MPVDVSDVTGTRWCLNSYGLTVKIGYLAPKVNDDNTLGVSVTGGVSLPFADFMSLIDKYALVCDQWK